jgi:hypothetical protein
LTVKPVYWAGVLNQSIASSRIRRVRHSFRRWGAVASVGIVYDDDIDLEAIFCPIPGLVGRDPAGMIGQERYRFLSSSSGAIINMKHVSATLASLLVVSLAITTQVQASKYPIMEKIADKVVEKYENSSCSELRNQKKEKSEKGKAKEMVIQKMKNDPEMRKEFVDRVAAPIVNKLFECGMIP